VDTAGSLYIADTANYRVRKVTNGVITTVAGNGSSNGPLGDGGPATAATVIATAVALDPAGNLYIGGNNSIRKVTPGGIISTFSSTFGTVSLSTDPAGKLYASNSGNILLVTDSGAATFFSSGGASFSSAIFGIAADGIGNVYAAADFGERILKIDAGGK